MVMTRSKRVKRVLRCLSISQHDDEILCPSITPLIRYNLLYNYNRCRHVLLDLADAGDPFPRSGSYSQLPKFLRSQLEAQKIADGSRLWSQIEPLLTFIQSNLRKLGRSTGFPTLFFWYSRENHRSYFFFAFVENKMASKTYTSRELLRLRHLPVGKHLYDQLHQKLQKDADLCEIFRMPPERALPLIKEEPVNTSGDSDDYEPAKKRLSRQLDGTDSEWKYRGRTGSEQAETQPIPAPTGLAAQKDEGFQRFYKAVVSPTHIRVTAGGRIVPNTRGSSSPTAKWVKDKTQGDGVRVSGRDVPEQANAAQPASFGGLPPIFPGFVPGMLPSGFPHLPGPFPMMPWQMGFNLGSAFGLPPHPLSQQLATAAAAAAAAQNSSKADKQSDPAMPENQVPVQLSPPDQFDPTRPFFFNGQWLWSQYYPFGMPGTPGLPPAPMLGPPMAPHRFGLNPMMLPQSPRLPQPGQPLLPNMPASPLTAVPNHVVPAKPPISSIRPSEITRKQIDVLRGSLRYFEDQLQYNKHQIDEKNMEHQAQVVRQQIQQFEKNLESQLVFEESHYPRTDTREESNSSQSSQNGVQTKPLAAGYGKPIPGNDSNSSSQDEASIVCAAKTLSIQEGGSAESSGNGSDFTKPPPTLSSARVSMSSPRSIRTVRKVSSLPVTAALAPPFQPRVDVAMPLSAGHNSGPSSDEEPPKVAVSSAADSSNAPSVADEETIKGEPYLVGKLPPHILPEHATDKDYIYPRQLNEDELRARHMYWGRAPSNLQSGLPKFNGRDFYPASPIKRLQDAKLHGPRVESYQAMAPRAAAHSDADPFQAVTKQHRSKRMSTSGSRVLSEHSAGERFSGSSYVEASRSKTLRPSAKSAANIRILVSPSEGPSAAPSLGSSPPNTDSEDPEEDKSLIFKGRNTLTRHSTRTRNDIWQSVLKRGTSSANAVQGTVTSMTAQGVLPQYTGHATASLAPAMTNSSTSPRRSTSRHGATCEAGTATPAAEKQTENRPPGENKLTVHRGTSARSRPAPTLQ